MRTPHRALLAIPILVAACATSKTTTTSTRDAPPAAKAAAPRPALVVLNKAEATVSFVDVENGALIATLPVGIGPHEAATSPDGSLIVVCNYGAQQPGHTLTVISVPTRAVAKTIDVAPNRRPHGVAFMPDGRHALVTAEMEKRLLVVDLDSGKVVASIDTDQDASHMVVRTPDGKRAFVANIGSGSVSVIDLDRRALAKVVKTGAGSEGIAMHPTRPEVWVGNRAGDTVSVIDTNTLEVVAEIPCAKFPIRVACTPDGKHALVSCAQSGDVAVIDCATRAVTRRIPMDAPAVSDAASSDRMSAQMGNGPVPVGVLISPDGRAAYVANTNADVVKVIDLSSWRIFGELRGGKEPDGMTWVAEP